MAAPTEITNVKKLQLIVELPLIWLNNSKFVELRYFLFKNIHFAVPWTPLPGATPSFPPHQRP
jgi:hypothetical protein